MFKKTALYTIGMSLLLLQLIACASNTLPAQALSEARQVLARAQLVLKSPLADADKTDYQNAERYLLQAEEMVKLGRYDVANPLIDQSKQASQAILQRHKADVLQVKPLRQSTPKPSKETPISSDAGQDAASSNDSNVKFRYE